MLARNLMLKGGACEQETSVAHSGAGAGSREGKGDTDWRQTARTLLQLGSVAVPPRRKSAESVDSDAMCSASNETPRYARHYFGGLCRL